MRFPIICIVILFFTQIGTALSDPPHNYPFVSYDAGIRLAQAEKKPMFIYFGRLGCGFCAKTNAETFSDPALRERYIKHYVLVYVDAESGNRVRLPTGERITEAELGARWNVFATPIFLYADMNGHILFRAPGFKTVKDFMDMDRFIREGHYKTMSINQFLGAM